MVVNTKLLLNILAVIGVYDTVNFHIILFAALFVGFYYISIIFSVVAALYHFASPQFFKVCITYIFHYALALILWPLFYIRRRKIHIIFQRLCRYRNQYNINDNYSTLKQKILVILVLTFFTLSQLLYHFEDELEYEKCLKYWTMNFKLSKGYLKFLLTVVINLMFFTIISFPVLMTFILSVILYKWGEILQLYNKSLQLQSRTLNKYKTRDHFVDFFKMTKILRDINQVLNYPLLFIIFYSLEALFMSFYDLITWRGSASSICIASFMSSCSAVLMLMMYSFAGSKISENLIEIKLTAHERINEHVFGLIPSIPENILMCLRRIETQKNIYICVGGVFRLTKSFVLSAIGSALTYDLLLISIFMPEINKKE